MKQNIQTLPIASIRRDSGAQFRVDGLSQTHVANLADAIENGAKLPPIIVFFDGALYWMADGDHRIEAHMVKHLEEINADVREGGQLDAKRFGRGANADHGLPRSVKTKRAAVEDALRDPEWVSWSNVAIAKECHVSHEFVRQMRNDLGLTSNVASESRTFRDKHGNVSTMSTANIGAKKGAPQLIELDPSELKPIWEPTGFDFPLSLLTDKGFIIDGDTIWRGINMGIEAGAPLDEKLPMRVDIWPYKLKEDEVPVLDIPSHFYKMEVYWYGGDKYTETPRPVPHQMLVAQLAGLGVTAEHLGQFVWSNKGLLTEAEAKYYTIQRALDLGVLLRGIESMAQINPEAPTVAQWLEENLPMVSETAAGLFMNAAALRYPDPKSEDEFFDQDDSDEAFQDWAELRWFADAAWMNCDISQVLPLIGEIIGRMKEPATA